MTIKYIFNSFIAFVVLFFFSNYSFGSIENQSGTITVIDTVTNVTCTGGNDGQINLTVSGLDAPFTFFWSNNETTEDISGLNAGNYTCTVFDAAGDSVNLSFIVTEPSPIQITGIISNVLCNGNSDGAIDITVTGGTGSYFYTWNNGSLISDLSNINAGSYTITVTDFSGCSANQSFIVTEPSKISFTSSVINNNCYGGNLGSISIDASGGVGLFTFLWSNGSSSNNLSSLLAGNYTLTITDGNNCFKDSVFQITEGTQIIINSSVADITCNGLTDGSISVLASGGTGSFNYLWDNAIAQQNISGLSVGTYNLLVKDVLGCDVFETYSINEPDVIAVQENMSDVSCYGFSNGSISLTSTGGVGNYSYLWSNNSIDSSLQNIVAGNYTVIVTDANGCTASESFTINQPDSLNLSGVVTDVSCNGSSDGSINLSVTGGTTPYNYLWSNGSATQNLNGLSAGTYTVTVTDANNCSVSDTYLLIAPQSASISLSNTNPTCGASNGSISANVSGGVSPYSYLWSNSSTASSLSNVAAGSYTLTVTDANGCTAIQTSTLTNQNGPSIISAITINPLCNGGSNGTIDISVTSGTNPLSYNWSNGQTSQDASGLSAGNYTVTVTDANSCSATAAYSVGQPVALSISFSQVNPSCGLSNGSISANVSGGVSPYSYLWSNSSTASSLSNVTAGAYTIIVTDANGCTAVQTSTLTNQNGPSIISAITTNPLCNGGSNGSIDISVTGGTNPLSYNWSNGQTSQDASGLSAGNYTVTVTDANSCSATAAYSVGQPVALSISFSQVNPSCGLSNGSISANVSGGNSPYSYLWSNSSTASSLSNVTAGSYTLTVTDANGCTAIQTSTLTNQNGPTLSSAVVVNPLCNAGSNGSIDISIAGGTSPFSYAWSNGQTSQDASGLSAGNYTVTVTDANNCSASNTYLITQPSVLSANIVTSATTCNLNNGSASVNVSGGSGTYTYLWSNSSATSSIGNIASGNYTVTITDGNGCSIIRTGTVTATLPPVVVQSTLTNVLCNGDSTGAITISVSNGTSPFTFLWSNGAATQNISNLKNGSYTVTVTDANGCTNSRSFTITQPTFLSLANVSIVNATCGQANGSAQLNPSGSVSPYSYLWSNGSTTNQLINVSAGTYSVTVTDANGCTRRRNVLITNTNGPLVTLLSQTNVNCFGASTGAIDISISGGVLPYSYAWSNSAITQDVTGLIASDYTVTITDANNCTATALYTITQVAALSINPILTNTGCLASSGSIDAGVTGGTSPYNYSWNNGSTTSSIINLSAGSYSLTVTDNNGCTSLWSGAITGSGSPTAVFTITDVSCFGFSDGAISSTVTGGVAPYSFQWNNGSATSGISNILVGNYTVTITDQSGCTAVYSNIVSGPAQISLNPVIVNNNCYGAALGSIQLNVTGGTGPYNYLWNNGASSNSITSLIAGNYNVTVTDSHSCIKVGVYSITQNPLIFVGTWVVAGNTCNGASAGSINLSIGGGSGSYSYLWSNGATTEDISNLAAGTYTLTVTDGLSCTNSFTYTITDPSAINASTSAVNPTCGQSNGSASVSASGGTGTLSYLWNTGATTAAINSISAGTYTVTISDANGCTSVKNVTLINQAGPSIVSGVVTPPLCFGGSNGSVNITVSGGTSLLNYNWSNGQTIQDASGLSAGIYTVTITDANNCSTSANYTVSQPSAITASIASTPSTCGQSNGVLTVTASGGTPGYSYLWSNGNTLSSINSLAANTYTVTITDIHACTLVQSAVVTGQPSPVVVQISLTNVLCNGDSTGSINININNGTSPFNYLWSNGVTSQNVSNLPSGSYSVTVTDANGCTGAKSFFISQPTFLSLANFNIVNSTCGQANGSVLVSPAGGVSPYTYLWNNGAVINQISNVSAGLYSVTVTDLNGCTRKRNFTVQNTNGPVVTLSNQNSVSCYGGSNAAIDILVTAGVAPYSYTWSNGAITQDLSNIPAGDYTVTVTDANGCIAAQQITVVQPDSISLLPNVNNANCGQPTGSIGLQISGGTSPYTYNWSSGGVNASIVNIVAGNYTVTVTDSKLCTIQRTINVLDNPSPVILLDSIVNSNCYNQSLGDIYVSASSGNGNYTYQWSSGSNNQDLINVIAGTYQLTITDGNGCSSSNQFIISQPNQITASFNVTNANCNLSNGSAIVTAIGGSGNYSYQWSNGALGNTISNQSLGVYTVTITDNNNCSVIDSVNIFNSGQAVVNLITQINPTCNNLNNGQLTVNVFGGLGPYQLQWSNGNTGYSNNGLTAGNYILTVTDITGCSSQTAYQLVEPDPITILFTSNDEHCGQSDGSINAIASGGNGAYNYLWSNNSTTTLISNITGGVYSLTVTDIFGCSAVSSQTISNILSPVFVQSSVTDANCYNASTGLIDINIQGGVLPYTYLWSNNDNSEDLINVTSGNYSVTVTDAYGCTVRRSFTVSQPDSIAIDAIVDNAGCGNNNGMIMISVTGGTGTYTYNWSNGLNNDTIQNLYAGVYTVIVSDINNCIAQKIVPVSNVNSAVISVDSIIDVKCFGENNGAIYTSLTQGEAPFNFEWSNGVTTSMNTSQPAGQYILTVTDNNGCISILVDTINQPDIIQLSSFVVSPKCNLPNGTITLSPTGGTLPYSFLWNTGQTSSSITGINTGVYSITLTDANGCSSSRIDSIVNSGNPIITLNNLDSVSCNGLSDGSIDITVADGVMPYFYQWVGTGQNTEDLNNIPAGGYSLIVTDDLGCTTSQSYTIYQPTQIQVNLLAVQNASCGSNNGYAVVNAIGGAGNFNYYWSNATNNDTLFNVNAGSYTLVAVDESGCTSSIIVNVSNINGPSISSVDSSNVSCSNVNDGYINIQISGGTLPYVYSWNNLPDTLPSVSGLTGGSYTLTVTDALNCIVIRTVTITKPQPIVVNGYVPSLNPPYNLSCFKSDDGSIVLNLSGGTSPYSYVWSNGNVSQNIFGLQAGTYTVYITDNNGCLKDSTFFVTQPPQLTANAGTDFNVCGQTSANLLAIQPMYGIGNWVLSNGPATNILFSDSTSNTSQVSNLQIGDYTFYWIVSDGICSDTDAVFINVSSQIIAQAGSDKTLCGKQINLNGTRPQFGYGYWSNSSSAILADTSDPFTLATNLNYGMNIFNWVVVNGTCRDTGTVSVFVRDSLDCLDPVLLPNAFTPNNDGYNDLFEIKGIQDFLDNEITIFNRWGLVVYNAENYSNTWDGHDNSGKMLPDGTYFAVLKLRSINKFYKTYIDLRR